MVDYLNRTDLAFQLYDVLDVERFASFPKFEGQGRDLYDPVLETAYRIGEDLYRNHVVKADIEEPEFVDGTAKVIPEVKAALDAYIEAGFMGAGFDPELGGMGLPFTLVQAIALHFFAANLSTSGFSLLTIGAANLLAEYANEDQTERFLKPMVEGRFFGTMCLSETQAGSSLADIRTRAEPQADGTYRLFGSKMWISAGNHELSENIVHLVLAKIPGGAPGVGGISLFIVPKFLVKDDGTLGARNDVRLAGLNHKMGYRGLPNTVLSFGEEGGAVGYLVGEPHRGLGYMFHMMNEARIGVGLGAAALGQLGYKLSLDYARERPQGRKPGQKDPASSMVPIIEHADVKRMLLQQKAYSEGAIMLCLYAATLIDEIAVSEGAAADQAHLLLEFLTPIVKSWPSEFCLKANDQAIQIHGGYGYTREYEVERVYRDNRLNPIHEGAKAIHGIDLLGRKVRMKQGAAFAAFAGAMEGAIEKGRASDAVAHHADALAAAFTRATGVTRALAEAAPEVGEEAYLANATLYLDVMGHLAVGWQWLDQARVAAAKLAEGTGDEAHLKGKLAAADYFFAYELPEIGPKCDLLERLDQTCMNADPAWF